MTDKFQTEAKIASTNVTIPVILRSTTDNTEVTGKTYSDMTGSYWREGGTRTAITMATLAAVDSAHSDGGFKEVDSGNMPGVYRFDIPDAALVTGADWVVVSLKCTGAYAFHQRFYLGTQTSTTVYDDADDGYQTLEPLIRDIHGWIEPTPTPTPTPTP